MELTFLETLWINVYSRAFDRMYLERSQSAGYATITDAMLGERAAAEADAACVNLPGVSLAALQGAIALLKP
jgi:hypothetical protein